MQVTRSLAAAYADKNIRVNCPGLTHPGMVKAGDSFDNAVLPLVPVKRAAQPRWHTGLSISPPTRHRIPPGTTW
ncbi:MAG TPA: hypothetical protein PLG75_07505 [Methanoculleus sp.]|nr:hypothetical protein [Methanoculleus sp.]